MWRWEDVKMRRWEDEKMWRWEDVKMSRWEDLSMRRCEDVKMRRCEEEKMWGWEDVWEDVKMWRWAAVKMWGCEDERMWRWEDAKMWRCEDEKMWGCEDGKMWGWEDDCEEEKMFYRPPLLEEPCAQTLSGKRNVVEVNPSIHHHQANFQKHSTRKFLTWICLGKSSCRFSVDLQTRLYRWFHQRVSFPSINNMGLSEDWASPKSVSFKCPCKLPENSPKESNPKRQAHAEALARWPNVVLEWDHKAPRWSDSGLIPRATLKKIALLWWQAIPSVIFKLPLLNG